ncbi:MAG: hypothetical protein LBD55_07465 [Treponema sp.]|jgi:hypothetical protein|nr:hypothetical protein [Treponema sp.]
MAVVRYFLEDGKELTREEQEAARQRIQAAGMRPYATDPDCPLLTEKQLAQFQPVNFATMEERNRAMREAERAKAGAGVREPELAHAGK